MALCARESIILKRCTIDLHLILISQPEVTANGLCASKATVSEELVRLLLVKPTKTVGT